MTKYILSCVLLDIAVPENNARLIIVVHREDMAPSVVYVITTTQKT